MPIMSSSTSISELTEAFRNKQIFFLKLCGKELNIPEETQDNQLPYVFIGDEAFALREGFLMPYNQRALTHDRCIYNYRLSRARRIVENAFGISVARFRIFRTAMSLKLENIEAVVMACCVLHNFLCRKSASSYTPPECFDSEDFQSGTTTPGLETNEEAMPSLNISANRNISEKAKISREKFTTYFNGAGRVYWQENFI